MRAVFATEHLAFCFDAVADDAAVAVRAARREPFDRALKAVEGVRVAARHPHRERLVVAVAADFAGTHWHISFRFSFLSSRAPALRRTLGGFLLDALFQQSHQ